MRRAYFLLVLLLGGAASMVVAAQLGPAPGTPPMRLEKLRDNLYVLHGGCQCGNTTFYLTDGGVVMVDTKVAGNGQKILEQLRTITDKPIAMIINTHTHYDHTGSNTEFGAIDQIVTHANAKASLSQATCNEPPSNCSAFKGDNAKYLPNVTFTDKRTLHVGKAQIDLYNFGAGHTNGDAWIVFPALRTVLPGDLFARMGFPVIDTSNGGSALAFADTLAKGVAGLTNVDTVITGHDIIQPWANFVRYSEIHKAFRAYVLAGMKAGKTAEEVANAYMAPDNSKDFQVDRARVLTITRGIYDESKGK